MVNSCLLLVQAMSHLRKKHLEVGDKSLEASMLCISSEVNMVPRPGLMDQWVDGFDGLTVDVLKGPSVVWHLFPLLFFWGGGGWGKTYDFDACMGVGFPGYATVTQAENYMGKASEQAKQASFDRQRRCVNFLHFDCTISKEV